MNEVVSRGRPPVCRDQAVLWVLAQPWFAEWKTVPTYKGDRQRWRVIADAVREQGFFSHKTGTIDVPVDEIVRMAMAIRDAGK